jgi:thioredoxin reductase
MTYDIIIIGVGPSGLMAAIAAINPEGPPPIIIMLYAIGLNTPFVMSVILTINEQSCSLIV